MTRLYLSGGITNVPDFRERFAEAEERLRAAGYDCVNPAENACSTCGGSGEIGEDDRIYNDLTPCPDCPSWAQYVKAGIAAMLACDGVATLPEYEKSRGASLEVYVANHVGIGVAGVERWIRNGPVVAGRLP